MQMVIRATRKRMLWYLEQHKTHAMVLRATSKLMLKVFRAIKEAMT